MATVTISQSVQNQQQDALLCDHDKNPTLLVTRVLTTNSNVDEDQRTNLFQTRTTTHGISIKVIIDGGSCHNFASTTLCNKLHLPLSRHPMPYQVQWLDGKETFTIEHKVHVPIKIGAYEDTIECDVVPMKVCHMLLGRPWQFEKVAIHDGRSNQYSFKWNDKLLVLIPMTPTQIHDESTRAPLKSHHTKDPCKLSGERVTHNYASESHTPNLSGKITSATPTTTTREMSDLSETHTNLLSPSSSSLLSVLQ